MNARLPDLPVEIRWTPSELIADIALNLIDEATGDIMDMHSVDDYTYSGSASRSFRIEDTSGPDLPRFPLLLHRGSRGPGRVKPQQPSNGTEWRGT